MYLRVNADFSFCALIVFPSFCTSWRSFCRFEVDESLFAVSQTPSIRDFLTPKLNKFPCLLFILKFKSVGLLNLKNHGIGFRNKHLHTSMRTCKETVFGITRFENRIQTALIFNFSGKIFFMLSCWLITDICTDISVINSGNPFPECWKISIFENSRLFVNISMFKNTRLGHWHLLHRCYLAFRVWAFRHIHEYYSPQNISTIKYLLMKNV